MVPILIALGAILLAIVAASYHFSSKVIKPHTLPVEFTYQHEVEDGKIVEAEFNAWPREEVRIRSPYGYDLFGLWFPLPGARKTTIICHGITWTLYGSVKYMPLFRKRGYNILIYDHRNHGCSGGHDTTFGYYEKHDLSAVVDWVLAHCGADCRVAVHGESMGAGIALQHAAIDPRVACYVADCPYADLPELLRFRLRQDYHLPPFPLLTLALWFARLRSGADLRQVSPARDMPRIETPILFMHGRDDDYIPPQMSESMYAAKAGPRGLYLAPNAGHAQAFWNNQEEYDRILGEFLEGLGL
jgi:uncharacterized protein